MKYIGLIVALFFCVRAFGQQTQPLGPKATLVNLFEPLYPPLARQANIWGDVKVTVTVRPDHTTETVVEGGHPMLRQAAMDSAEKSRFECRLCSSAEPYILIYSFTQVEGRDCCTAMSQPAMVRQEPAAVDEQGLPRTRIVVSAESICLCDPGAELTMKVRSLKCLYLWKCSMRTN